MSLIWSAKDGSLLLMTWPLSHHSHIVLLWLDSNPTDTNNGNQCLESQLPCCLKVQDNPQVDAITYRSGMLTLQEATRTTPWTALSSLSRHPRHVFGGAVGTLAEGLWLVTDRSERDPGVSHRCPHPFAPPVSLTFLYFPIGWIILMNDTRYVRSSSEHHFYLLEIITELTISSKL